MLTIMMKKESVAVLALFMTMASCLPIFQHNDTSHHNYSIAGLEAINMTKMQKMIHTAMEMTTHMLSKTGLCNDTMTAQWMECGPCVLDPCVMVLTHNCTYGSQDVHHNMNTHFPFHHWFQFFQHLGQYHTESEMESTSEEEPAYPMVSETCQKVQHNTSACFEVQEQCHRCRGIKLDPCLPASHEHYSTLQYLSSELLQET